MKELISIIVPIYKVEKYLKKCVNSIINQTYKQLEIILVDDGSPDNCNEMCDDFAKSDSRIKVIHKENGGLSSARNVGIDNSSGEYLMFIDSDDFILENTVETLYFLIKNENADIALCSINSVDENGKSIDKYNRNLPIKDETLTCMQILPKIVDNNGWVYVVACNKLYKKELFNNLRYSQGKIHEDEFIIHHLYYSSNKIVCTKQPFYHYVRRSNSIITSEFTVKNFDAVEAFVDRTNFYIDKKLYKFAGHEAIKSLNLFNSYLERINIRDAKDKSHIEKVKKLLFSSLIKIFFLKNISIKHKIRLLIDWAKGILKGKSLMMIEIKGFLKKILPVDHMRQKLFENKLTADINKIKKQNKKAIFLLATPIHGNLGDQAIVRSEYKFIKECMSTHGIIEIPNDVYRIYKNILKKYVTSGDIVALDGGGNLGTLWTAEDDKINEIIDTYRQNKIIIFPQTCYFSDDEQGQIRKKNSAVVYEKHNDLTIALRDMKSFEFVSRNFPTVNAVFTPDMVLYIDDIKSNTKRAGVIFCLRKDLEKTMHDDTVTDIKKYLDKNNIPFIDSSTIISKCVTKKSRDKVLNKKFSEFASCRLIITDRLHGMIFAAITGTPCIAVDNLSNKVSGTYEWIKYLPYIKFFKSCDSITENISEMYNLGGSSYYNTPLKEYYYCIKKAIEK